MEVRRPLVDKLLTLEIKDIKELVEFLEKINKLYIEKRLEIENIDICKLECIRSLYDLLYRLLENSNNISKEIISFNIGFNNTSLNNKCNYVQPCCVNIVNRSGFPVKSLCIVIGPSPSGEIDTWLYSLPWAIASFDINGVNSLRRTGLDPFLCPLGEHLCRQIEGILSGEEELPTIREKIISIELIEGDKASLKDSEYEGVYLPDSFPIYRYQTSIGSDLAEYLIALGNIYEKLSGVGKVIPCKPINKDEIVFCRIEEKKLKNNRSVIQ